MEKCKKCRERGEHWISKGTLFIYCGLIERVIEDAIDINDIKVCPYELLMREYREPKRQNFEGLYKYYLKEE